jgi:hypothetical protein
MPMHATVSPMCAFSSGGMIRHRATAHIDTIWRAA